MVDRRWLGTSVIRVRVLAAGLVVLGAGCAVLGWGSRTGQSAAGVIANDAARPAAMGIAANETPAAPATAQSLPSTVSPELKSRARSVFAGLPLIFEPNVGQGRLDPADRRAKFVTRGPGYSLFLGPEGAILSTVSKDGSKPDPKSQKHNALLARVNSLQMKLVGANANASLTGAALLPGKSNYFLGNDPAKWHTGVQQFARVRYENIYPGINLVFYGNQGRLEYDFQVEPGSDPAQAELEFNGAKQLQLQDGALVIRSEGSSVQLNAPRVYQEIAGRQQPVEGRFVLRGAHRAGFAIGQYDHSRELVIDPILTFATYFGGSGDERATSIAVDANFNIYLAGSTTSPNLPTTVNVFQPALAAGATQNVYIAKITPPLGQTAATLDYVTYLGGDGIDAPVGIEVDSAGNPYVAGTTSSSNFPTTASNAYQTVPETPGTHVFVTEMLSSAATLQYSSYLSGNGTDMASGMAIDASGYVYVTGTTTSTDAGSTTDQFPASTLPEALPFQIAPKGPKQFFVTKVNTNAPSIGSIAYSTYFGGGDSLTNPNPIAVGGGIAVDTNGNVYFSGTTNYLYTGSVSATDFPILNAYQPCLDIAPPQPIQNPQVCTPASQTPPPAASDAFVAKLNPNAPQGEQLLWSTYVGGTETDSGTGVAVDTGAANVYLVGTTNSFDIRKSETLNNSSAYQLCLDQPVNPVPPAGCTLNAPGSYANDAFVARLSNPTPTTGSGQNNVTLNYLSYLGGSGNEAGLVIAVDSASGALVTGWTQSSGAAGSATAFPVFPTATIQSTLTGAQDAFFARLNTAAQLGQTNGSWATYYAGGSADIGNATLFTEGTGVALDVNQNSYFAGDTNSPNLQVQGQLVTPATAPTGYNGGYDAFATQLSSALSLSITGVLTLGPNQSFVDAGNQATFTYTITNNGPDQASNITVVDDLSSQVTGVALNFVSASASAGTCGGGSTNASVSCSLPTLQSGATATVTIVLTPTPSTAGTQAAFNGGSVQVMGTGNNVLAHALVGAQMGDYTIAINPADNSVPAGQTAPYQVVLSPHPVYSSKITLACTGLPPGAACNFTNSPVTLLGPGSSTLNITTTARPINPVTGSLLTRHFYAAWLVLPGLTLLGVGAGSNRRRRRILGILLFCALFAMLLLQPACSSSNTQLPVSGTPAGTYRVTVSAVSGSDTKSSVVSLTVQ